MSNKRQPRPVLVLPDFTKLVESTPVESAPKEPTPPLAEVPVVDPPVEVVDPPVEVLDPVVVPDPVVLDPAPAEGRPTFEQWANSPEGRKCADPWFPKETFRAAVDLRMRLKIAWEAGASR
jgi:hypothetical protein